MSRIPPVKYLLIAACLIMTIGGCFAVVHNSLRKAGQRMELGQRLWLAVSRGHATTAQLLLRQGADPNYRGESNILLRAIQNDHQKTIQLLLRFGANPSLALYDLDEYDQGDLRGAETLLKLGADVNARLGYAGWSPLMEHGTSAKVDVVRFLLSHGANPHQKDDEGYSLMERVQYAAGNHPERHAKYQAVIELIQRR